MYWLRWHSHVKDIAGAPLPWGWEANRRRWRSEAGNVTAGLAAYHRVYVFSHLWADSRGPESTLEPLTSYCVHRTTFTYITRHRCQESWFVIKQVCRIHWEMAGENCPIFMSTTNRKCNHQLTSKTYDHLITNVQFQPSVPHHRQIALSLFVLTAIFQVNLG